MGGSFPTFSPIKPGCLQASSVILHHHFVFFSGPKWHPLQYNTEGTFHCAFTNHQTLTSFIIINRSKKRREGHSYIIKFKLVCVVCAYWLVYAGHVNDCKIIQWSSQEYSSVSQQSFYIKLSQIKLQKLSSKHNRLLMHFQVSRFITHYETLLTHVLPQ